MTIQIDCFDPNPMCLEDVLAYEFFMDNINLCFQAKEQDAKDLADSVAVLAKSAYLIADLFSEARQVHIQKHSKEANVES
jgi:hypothetical protein